MPKKRYALYLSRPLANKLELVASQRHGSKSALLEEALRRSLEPEQVPGVEEALIRRLNELQRVMAGVARDQAVATETLALFVRYFLTVTPPIPEDDQESARLVGRKRYDVFVAEVGRRVAEDRRLAADVLQTITRHQPDLFASAIENSRHAAAAASPSQPLPESNGHA